LAKGRYLGVNGLVGTAPSSIIGFPRLFLTASPFGLFARTPGGAPVPLNLCPVQASRHALSQVSLLGDESRQCSYGLGLHTFRCVHNRESFKHLDKHRIGIHALFGDETDQAFLLP